MLIERASLTIELRTDGYTVWVNAPEGCVARFADRNVEIYGPGGVCVLTASGPTTPEDWLRFQRRVWEAWAIDIPERFRPMRLLRRKMI